MRSSGSKVGIGLDPDGFSSSLDMMKTVGVFCVGDEHSEGPSGDPEEILSSEGSEDFRRVRRCRNLPSMWCKPMVGVEDF